MTNRRVLADPLADSAACDRYDCGHVARHADAAMRHAGILYRLVMTAGEGVLSSVSADASTLAALSLMRQGAACREVADRYRDPVTNRYVASAPTREGKPLTRGQVSVLRALSTGRTPEEAAPMLSMQAETVKSHRKNAYAALGVHSLADAIAEAYRQGYPVI